MQRRALSRSVCLVRPRQATISLGVRNLNINTNAASASPVSTLNTLIETTKDSKEGFKTAADHVKDANIKKNFQEYAQQREQFSKELQDQVKKLGGTPETSGSTLGAIHRGWVNLKSALTVSDKAIVSEVVNGETVAEKYFVDASKDQSLPQEALGLVQKQHAKVQESLNYAKDLYNKL
ncbi:uncharacterized protein ACA1_253410 [Acanthamoeba castellanii str. Neff]|uniref:DUF2383 domain-containing protein n=1 Tax=Acanthamoeba castellanii (strain ATCC 30010 / Neff) TaxID=1257118 RepID=L8HAX5_ACACF|nr:uncharacterized protein ACA1_253410 [Acanthamoeba castellanii str. Neff]ELR22355.1 hypothetical protein ACA1_253410 [Acanthamoeba castellanii str. Neff]